MVFIYASINSSQLFLKVKLMEKRRAGSRLVFGMRVHKRVKGIHRTR